MLPKEYVATVLGGRPEQERSALGQPGEPNGGAHAERHRHSGGHHPEPPGRGSTSVKLLKLDEIPEYKEDWSATARAISSDGSPAGLQKRIAAAPCQGERCDRQ